MQSFCKNSLWALDKRIEYMEHHYAETGKVNVDRPVFVWLVQPTIACYMYGSGCCGELMGEKSEIPSKFWET